MKTNLRVSGVLPLGDVDAVAAIPDDKMRLDPLQTFKRHAGCFERDATGATGRFPLDAASRWPLLDRSSASKRSRASFRDFTLRRVRGVRARRMDGRMMRSAKSAQNLARCANKNFKSAA